MLREKKIEKPFAEKKSHSVFEGFKEGPFQHTKTVFSSAKCFEFFVSTFIKNHFIPIKKKSQKYAGKKILTARSSNCSVSAKFFFNVGENALFWRGHK